MHLRIELSPLLLLLVGLGCGDSAGTGDLTDRPVPKLEARPSAVVFGRVPVGAAASEALTLTNVGNAAAAPSWAAGSAPRCEALGASDPFCIELDLAPIPVDGQREATVFFFPRAEAPPIESAWTLDCGEGCVAPLTGRGSGVNASISAPAMLDFGRMFPGCDASQTFELRSDVDVPLVVSSVRIESDIPAAYELDLPRAPPFELAPGATEQLGLRFVAPDGDVPGFVRVEVSKAGLGYVDDLEVRLAVELIGRGDQADPPCN